MIEILALAPEMKEEFVKVVPALVRLLRSFISMGFSPEHDVGGITDPFVQVKLLTLMRVLGRGNDEVRISYTKKGKEKGGKVFFLYTVVIYSLVLCGVVH